MANPYFEYSQEVRKEIESDSELVGAIKDIFDNRPEISLLGEGGTNQVFHVGRTKGGLYVALRLVKERGLEITDAVRLGEQYCAIAQSFAELRCKRPKHPRPLDFCIGAVYQDKTAGLLIEDITENRRYTLLDRGWGFDRVVEGKTDTILADFDGTLIDMRDYLRMFGVEIQNKNPAYFSRENRINLP